MDDLNTLIAAIKAEIDLLELQWETIPDNEEAKVNRLVKESLVRIVENAKLIRNAQRSTHGMD